MSFAWVFNLIFRAYPLLRGKRWVCDLMVHVSGGLDAKSPISLVQGGIADRFDDGIGAIG
jgi:hypothetical protein